MFAKNKSVNTKLKIFFSLLIFWQLNCFSQIDTTTNMLKTEKQWKGKRGWEVSGNFGVFKGNNFHAGFYSGAPKNVNNLNYVLNNQYWMQEIKTLISDYGQRDSISNIYYPSSMSYQPALYIGFSGRFHFSDQIALNIHVNTAQLVTTDFISFKVFPPYTGMAESYVNAQIYGKETRTHIDLGLMYSFDKKNDFNMFVEMGAHLSSTRVKESAFMLYDNIYSIVDIYGGSQYVPGAQLNEYDNFQGGLGFGIFASSGLRYTINEQACIELVPNFYLSTVNLPEYNNRLKLNFSTQFRIVVSPLFKFGKI